MVVPDFGMKQIYTFLTLLVLFSCGQQEVETKIPLTNTLTDTAEISFNLNSHERSYYTNEGIDIHDWEKYQDSLRDEILKGKENKILKESFLQEMYIRDVVSISNDSLFITIPFDLHGPDCGAPDCYSTDVSFSIKFEDTLIFPKNIRFKEHEFGCVDKEIKLSGSFFLVEKTPDHVIYYSPMAKRTLVLFSSNKANGTTAFYFTGTSENTINGENIYTIMGDYEEGDEQSIYPFTSWVLTTSEYENFIE